jgi:hypothetical protein
MPGAYRSAPDGEDISIVVAGDTDQQAPVRRDAAAAAPLACLVAHRSGSPPPLGLDGAEALDGAIALDGPPRLLSAQVDAWVRVAIAEEERRRRAATAAEVGAAAPQSLQPRKLKALYIGAPSTTFLALERALAGHNGLVAAAFTS